MAKKKSSSSSRTKRRSIRFKPEVGTIGYVDLSMTGEFKPALTALVAEESYRGCGLVALAGDELQAGTKCRVKIENGPALKAEVRWRSDLDAHVIRLGLMYLE